MEPLKIFACKGNNLFQSEQWADFQDALERKSWIIRSDNIEALVIKYPLIKDKSYFYSPRGPMISSKLKAQDLKVFFKKVAVLAKEEKAIFYRVEPYMLEQSNLYKYGFRKINSYSPMSRQFSPKQTLVIDLQKERQQLLSEMKPKWRYNISLADRRGVTVRVSTSIKDIEIFYKLTQEVEHRGDYHGYELKYYKKMYKTLSKNGTLRLYIAEFEGKALAAVLVSFFGTVATYLHGASSNEDRNLMPAYALQWSAMNDAKKEGMSLYDFWGISHEIASWEGITRFKKGFGGEEVEFSGAYDLPFSKPYYSGLSYANKIRKLVKSD